MKMFFRLSLVISGHRCHRHSGWKDIRDIYKKLMKKIPPIKRIFHSLRVKEAVYIMVIKTPHVLVHLNGQQTHK